MKKLFFVLVLVMCSGFVFAQSSNTDCAVSADTLDVEGPRITFEKLNHDFGEFKINGDAKSFEFVFVNDGTAPVVVTRTTTTCRCIRISAPRRPVGVGQKGVIKVTYTPDHDLGVFNKGIHIYSNSVDKHQILFVSGNVNKK